MECLLASGPELVLVLPLRVKCCSRNLTWNFAAGLFSRGEGCCVSLVPFEYNASLV